MSLSAQLIKVFIIAEAGVNHNGSLETAKKLIDVASESGADAVKFQTFQAEKIVSPKASKAKYQKRSTAKNESLFNMLKKLELGPVEHKKLIKFAKKKKILFLSTPFDKDSVDLLDKLKIPIYKISSGDITNFHLLEHIAKKNRPIILSTGRSTLLEVKEAVNVILKNGNKKLTLLHCISSYPASFDELNLRAIKTLNEAFKLPVGFSDHSMGIEASIAAVALGAKVIEKHFTLDKNMPGPDHKSSLSPSELKALVTGIRHIETALGDGKKKPTKSEIWGRENVRKSLYSNSDIRKGSRITERMIITKRPAKGLMPKHFKKVVGRVALKTIKKDTPLKWSMLGV